MSFNAKQSSEKLGTLAAKVLSNPRASALQKKLAGSVLSQAHTAHQTSGDMEHIAARALQDKKSSQTTRTLAASVLAQANKERECSIEHARGKVDRK